MIIGVDFDNTIVNYDPLIYSVCLRRKLIPKLLKHSKKAIRDFLRSIGKEAVWTELQGEIYGPLMSQARPYPGVKEFFKRCKKRGIKVVIISHKTKYPFIGEKHDLHNYANRWLDKNGFFGKGIGLSRKDVFLELTKENKFNRIRKIGCHFFIDDLLEFLMDRDFPADVKKVLFDPNNNHSDIDNMLHIGRLDDILNELCLRQGCLDKDAEYFISRDFRENIAAALKKRGINSDFTLEPLVGGKNNRVFRIDAGRKRFLLKAYFSHKKDRRDRLKSEFSFLKYVYRCGLRCVPKPLLSDAKNNLGIYEFIDGKKIGRTEIRREHIQAAAEFFRELNIQRSMEQAKKLPKASEAGFSLREHRDIISARVKRLKNIKPCSTLDKKARRFVTKDMWPVWSDAKRLISSVAKDKKGLKRKLMAQERCISPSDFGFHNALVNKKGRIFFIDFEYAGWDDPAKMVCDFFCQPQIPVPVNQYGTFIDRALSGFGDRNAIEKRIYTLYPLCRIKWCCIMLNEFLHESAERRRFANGDSNIEKRKAVQLRKTKIYLNETKKIMIKCKERLSIK